MMPCGHHWAFSKIQDGVQDDRRYYSKIFIFLKLSVFVQFVIVIPLQYINDAKESISSKKKKKKKIQKWPFGEVNVNNVTNRVLKITKFDIF